MIELQNAKSEAGEQSLPLDCRARARLKGMLFVQTPVEYDACLIGIIAG